MERCNVESRCSPVRYNLIRTLFCAWTSCCLGPRPSFIHPLLRPPLRLGRLHFLWGSKFRPLQTKVTKLRPLFGMLTLLAPSLTPRFDCALGSRWWLANHGQKELGTTGQICGDLLRTKVTHQASTYSVPAASDGSTRIKLMAAADSICGQRL